MGVKNIAYVNKEILKWARLQTPFKTTEDVEIQCHEISSEELKSWENGDSKPSVSKAKKLASIYKLPFASFYLSSIPEKAPKKYIDRRTKIGSEYGEISYKLWSEIENICSNRETLLEYSDDDIPDFPKCNDNDIDRIANQIREYLNLHTPLKNKTSYGSNPFAYYRNILEEKRILVCQIEGVSLDEMKGLSIYYDKVPIVALNTKDFNNSKSFTLFHELAHIFRRSSSLCMIDFDERNDEEEKMCDKIAAATLMPKTIFCDLAYQTFSNHSGFWDSYALTELAGKFGVSSLAVLLRLRDTNLISWEEYREYYNIISEEYSQNEEQILLKKRGTEFKIPYSTRYLNSNGYLLPKTMILSCAEGKISLGEVCKILNVNSSHIGKIEQAVMSK